MTTTAITAVGSKKQEEEAAGQKWYSSYFRSSSSRRRSSSSTTRRIGEIGEKWMGCVGSSCVSLVGGLTLACWEKRYHHTYSQLWMVPFGLVLLTTPPIVCFSAYVSDLLASDSTSNPTTPASTTTTAHHRLDIINGGTAATPPPATSGGGFKLQDSLNVKGERPEQ